MPSQKMCFLLTLPSMLPKDVPQKRPKNKSQLQIARSASRKYQCKNLRSSVRKIPGDQTRNRPEDHTILHRSSWQVICPSWDLCGYGGQQKMGFSTTLFQQKVCIAKKIWGHSGNFKNMCFFVVVSPFWSCSHISLRHSVSHRWVQTSMLHCGIWGLTNIPAAAIHRKKTSLQVLFETSRQILDESARIRSNSPSVVYQNGVVSVYSHVDLHAVTLEAKYGNMVPNNGRFSSYSHVWSLIGVSGGDNSFLETRTSPVRVAVQTKKHVCRPALELAKTVL